MKSKPKCKYCYDKGFYTVYEGDTICFPDFESDKYWLIKKGGIKKVNCPKCKKPKKKL